MKQRTVGSPHALANTPKRPTTLIESKRAIENNKLQAIVYELRILNYQLKVPACSHSSPHTDWLELPSLDALSPVGHSQPLFVSEHQGFRTVKLPYSALTTRRWLPMHQQLSFIHAETCTCVTPCLHPELQPDCIHGELPSLFGVHM